MNVNVVSDLTTQIMSQAAHQSGENVQQQITGRVMKQILDQQQVAADSLVQMIQTGSLTGTGKLVDVRA